ncbi:hypothetical protein HETIRDRAFT_411477 [Heterobasidion irregulare TC 32-1]|uniref:Uncharacterized protein n=1 Tax=Heterobasidion irregulare (strain TC 32-1) TaxID=747525 RepID=W4JUE7_HETIT|nr:uncharacterized protein HETIRDRAFT_411477 [Heterobasidion irregulare TC 32-1]ETW77089.1 hypothetical protein HETIRDRAFT_411477 [Heterobasidion irregulare TC 32-1]
MDTGVGPGVRAGAGAGPVRPESTMPLGLIAWWYGGFVTKGRASGGEFLEQIE